MKYILTILILFVAEWASAQMSFPYFLSGTWKVENSEVYEHWDKIDKNTLKGFSYKITDGQMFISEYLEIRKDGKKTIYSATVINQNSGKAVDFKLTQTDSTFTFENPNHDFPKKIVYHKCNDNEIYVQISDGKQKEFAYKMLKQFQKEEVNDFTITNPNYDKALAEKLGADDYGMKSYFLVILKTGTNTTANKELTTESFRAHLDNINRLVGEGKLVVAGPLKNNENSYRGIFILHNIKTLEEASKLLQTDLAIKNGLLDYEIFTWYGSAALPEYLPFSEKIAKKNP